MRLALLLVTVFALVGTSAARADDDLQFVKRYDVRMYDVGDLDVAAEEARDLIRRLLPGTRVECYGRTRLAILGTLLERWTAALLLRRAYGLVGSSRYGGLGMRARPWGRFTELEADLPGAVIRLRAEARVLRRLLDAPHSRDVVEEVYGFEEDVDLARLATQVTEAGESRRLRRLVLLLKLEAGVFLHRLAPYDLPSVADLREMARTRLDQVNQRGRDGAHHWRPGTRERGATGWLHPEPLPFDPQEDLATSREVLERALRLLHARGAKRRVAEDDRAHAYLLILRERHGARGARARPEDAATAIPPRLQEVIDFVNRIGRAVEHLSAQRKSR